MKMYSLECTEGAQKGKVYPLTRGESLKIGSGPAADIRLDDKDVARVHSIIRTYTDGFCSINDEGWTDKGTIVNGIPVLNGQIYVARTDTIRVGNAEFLVCVGVIEDE